jgi:hypothetical protein
VSTPPPLPSAERLLQERLRDFPHFLSPMLVKELRQGLRTNLFTSAFILLQVFMLFCVSASLASPGARDTQFFFWIFIVAMLLVVQPLRGFHGISSELSLNTLDLIQLTKLDGWRIAWGKWTALNAQSLLFVASVLPYLAMRYFVGNIDLVQDFLALGLISAGSAFATAVALGISVFSNLVIRGLLTLGFGIAFMILFSVTSQMLLYNMGLIDHRATLCASLLTAAYGIYFFLAFGASRISPLSENHSTRKRLVALVSAAAVCLFLPVFPDPVFVPILAGIILGFASVDALTEPLPHFAQINYQFRRPIFRPFAWFLAPGWCSGIGFLIVAASLWTACFLLARQTNGEYWGEGLDITVHVISAINIFLLPVAITRIFASRLTSYQSLFALYLFLQTGLGIITFLVGGAAAISSLEEVFFLAIPLPSLIIYAPDATDIDSATLLVIALATFGVCLMGCLLRIHRVSKPTSAPAVTQTSHPEH